MLAEILRSAQEAVSAASQGALSEKDITFEIPPDSTLGDLAFPCFVLAKKQKTSPHKLAAEVAKAIQPAGWIAGASAAGPYVNIRLNRPAVAKEVLRAAQKEKGKYGTTIRKKAKRVLIEYVQPNTNKPLHLGHLRNGLLGTSIAALLASQGHTAIKVNIVNDRGIHIAKSVLAYEKWGNNESPQSTGEKGDHFVGRFYVRFEQELQKEKQAWLNGKQSTDDLDGQFLVSSALMREARELLKRWEANDPAVRKIWKKMNGWVLTGFASTYQKLGIEFEKEYYESEIYQGGKEIILEGVKKGVFRKSEDGSVVALLQEKFGLPDKVLLRKDGTSLYITQDVNLAFIKNKEFHPDASIYVVGSEQELYFKQLFGILQLLELPNAERLVHLSYGYVSLPEGRMKSREGRVVDADDLLDELVKLAHEEVQKRYQDLSAKEQEHRAHAIALAGLKFHFLMVSKDAAMTYDPKASIAFEGNTGPYLQYTYARAKSILAKAGEKPKLPSSLALQDNGEWQLVLSILRFPQNVSTAAEAYDPGKLANALLEIAQLFNTFYHDQPVLKAEEPLRSQRLALVHAAATTIQNGLRMLGIETLEVM
ncbi:MAG: arginine--tRNA ligase [Candidatus Kerfeldbacteria bacterium]|nr:arginine--tRNA ligase [Candidatus Kerfeldbacteria bacterium]